MQCTHKFEQYNVAPKNTVLQYEDQLVVECHIVEQGIVIKLRNGEFLVIEDEDG